MSSISGDHLLRTPTKGQDMSKVYGEPKLTASDLVPVVFAVAWTVLCGAWLIFRPGERYDPLHVRLLARYGTIHVSTFPTSPRSSHRNLTIASSSPIWRLFTPGIASTSFTFRLDVTNAPASEAEAPEETAGTEEGSGWVAGWF